MAGRRPLSNNCPSRVVATRLTCETIEWLQGIDVPGGLSGAIRSIVDAVRRADVNNNVAQVAKLPAVRHDELTQSSNDGLAIEGSGGGAADDGLAGSGSSHAAFTADDADVRRGADVSDSNHDISVNVYDVDDK